MAKKKLTLEDMLVPMDEIPYEVPENWCWVKLGNISKITMGQSPKGSSYNDEGIGEILINGPVEFGPTSFSRTIEKKWTTEPTKMCDKDDIIMCVRGSVGKLNIAGNSACIGRGVCAIKPFINEKYLLYVLNFKQDEISKMGTGTTFLNISSKDIYNISIPVPPLAEQERIVNRIESLFDKVDRAAELVDEARDGFEKRRAAILERAFSGELTKKWREENDVSDEKEIYKLKDVADFKSGYAFKSTQFSESGIPVIRMGNLYNAMLDLSRKPVYVPKDYDSKIIEKYSVSKGDILLTLTGTKYKRDYGFAVLVENEEKLLLNQRILSLRAKEDMIDNTYLLYYLKTDLFRDVFFSAETGGVNQGNVSSKFVESIEISIPSIKEQKEVAKIVNNLLNQEEHIGEITEISEISDSIKKSILAKAFRGELGSNNLNEESSIELLKELIK